MKRWLLVSIFFLLALSFPTTGSAQGLCSGLPHPVICYAHETLTVSNTAVPFTASVYAPGGKQGPEIAAVTLEGDNIRVWYDGGVPTSTVGQLIQQPVFWVCGGDSIRKFLAIRQTTDATLNIEYCR